MKTQREIKSLNCREVLCESGVSPHYGAQCITSLTIFTASALWRMVAIISNYATSASGGNMAAAWFISPRKQTSLPKRFAPSIPGTLWPINPLCDLQVLLPPNYRCVKAGSVFIITATKCMKTCSVSALLFNPCTDSFLPKFRMIYIRQSVIPFFNLVGVLKLILLALCSCDRASWTKCEERIPTRCNNSDVYYQLLSQHVSGIIMPIIGRTNTSYYCNLFHYTLPH